MGRKRPNPKNRDWDHVWSVVLDLSRQFPDDIVFIGGIATYVYTYADVADDLKPEATHDADAVVDNLALGSLRDRYEVVINDRLKKSQVTMNDVEVDLYVERRSGLRYDFGEIAMHARRISLSGRTTAVRVASLAHLLLLKLDAWHDRRKSARGAKDARDVARLLMLIDEHADEELLVGLATGPDIERLQKIGASAAFMEIAGRNAKLASTYRKRAQRVIDTL